MPATSMLAGRACGRLSDDERTAIRRNDIGFVYQFHHLLPEFSALENVMMPQIIKGLPRAEAAKRAEQLLDYMQIGKRAHHRPAELSGGEQQRVAIARAVANAPLRPARRRADRQSRSDHGDLRLRRAGGAGEAVRARRPDRHPQSRACPAHGPPRHAGGRQGRPALSAERPGELTSRHDL